MRSIGNFWTAKTLPHSSQLHPTPFLKAEEGSHICGSTSSKLTKEHTNETMAFTETRDLDRKPDEPPQWKRTSLTDDKNSGAK